MNQRDLLRRAVDSEPVPADLSALVRTSLEGHRSRNWLGLLAGLAACCVLLVAGLNVYTVSVLRVGLNDHVHCGLGRNFPVQAESNEMAAALGPEFGPMVQPMMQKTSGLRLISAHKCFVGKRQYIHFVFEGSDGLTSVSITEQAGLEWLPVQQEREIDGQAVIGFEDDHYMVFVSSAQPKPDLAKNVEEVLGFRL